MGPLDSCPPSAAPTTVKPHFGGDEGRHRGRSRPGDVGPREWNRLWREVAVFRSIRRACRRARRAWGVSRWYGSRRGDRPRTCPFHRRRPSVAGGCFDSHASSRRLSGRSAGRIVASTRPGPRPGLRPWSGGRAPASAVGPLQLGSAARGVEASVYVQRYRARCCRCPLSVRPRARALASPAPLRSPRSSAAPARPFRTLDRLPTSRCLVAGERRRKSDVAARRETWNGIRGAPKRGPRWKRAPSQPKPLPLPSGHLRGRLTTVEK